MNQEAKVMIVVALSIATAIIVKTIASAVVRYAEVHRAQGVNADAHSIQERLERIEIAVDTIAIEVERLGEHHRFNAQLAMNRPEPLPPRVVTPH